MKLGAKLGLLTDFLLGGNGWKPPIESTLRTLDTLVQLNAQGFANAPPSANDGDTFIVGPAPGGAFAGQPTGTVARYHSATSGATFSGWQFDYPREGWWGYIGARFYYFSAGAWQILRTTELLASGPGFRAILHPDGTIVQAGIALVPPQAVIANTPFILPITCSAIFGVVATTNAVSGSNPSVKVIDAYVQSPNQLFIEHDHTTSLNVSYIVTGA